MFIFFAGNHFPLIFPLMAMGWDIITGNVIKIAENRNGMFFLEALTLYYQLAFLTADILASFGYCHFHV